MNLVDFPFNNLSFSEGKVYVAAICLTVLGACGRPIDVDKQATDELRIEAMELLSLYPQERLINIELGCCPLISSLNAKKIYVVEEGLYIQLRGIIEPNGLFVPRKGVTSFLEKDEAFISYREIVQGVYEYQSFD